MSMQSLYFIRVLNYAKPLLFTGGKHHCVALKVDIHITW